MRAAHWLPMGLMLEMERTLCGHMCIRFGYFLLDARNLNVELRFAKNICMKAVSSKQKWIQKIKNLSNDYMNLFLFN